MNWTDIVADRSLRELPYKIETNHLGQIVMSPASRRHSLFQARIIGLLFGMKISGEVYSECPIETTDGVKVADVAWASDAVADVQNDDLTFTRAPELCIEVLSPSNSKLEIDRKMTLYFEKGAEEVWICLESGKMEFHTRSGGIALSRMFTGFSPQV